MTVRLVRLVYITWIALLRQILVSKMFHDTVNSKITNSCLGDEMRDSLVKHQQSCRQ